MTRPKHWLDFQPFRMAHTPLKMSGDQAHAEVNHAWTHSYSPDAIAEAVESIPGQSLLYRVNMFIARLFFRGIYFPQIGTWAWLKLLFQNRRTIYRLVKEGVAAWRALRESQKVELAPEPTVSEKL